MHPTDAFASTVHYKIWFFFVELFHVPVLNLILFVTFHHHETQKERSNSTHKHEKRERGDEIFKFWVTDTFWGAIDRFDLNVTSTVGEVESRNSRTNPLSLNLKICSTRL